MRRALAVSALGVMAAACTERAPGTGGSGSERTGPEPTGPDPTRVEIYTAAFRSLADTEGWFEPVLLDDRICPSIGDPGGKGSCQVRFTEAEQAAIVAELDDLPGIRFVHDAERIQDRIFSGGLSGAGLLTVGAIDGDDERVTVGGRSYCGGLCGHWMTLVLRNQADGWAVTGTTGPVAIS